jgi:AbrB family looped-hinge helix DNA binding protein
MIGAALYFSYRMYNTRGRRLEMAQKISSKGWIVIPADIRKRHGLKPGDEVHVIDYGGVISLVPAKKDPIAQGHGMLAGGDSLVDALLEERRKDVEREERDYRYLAGDDE